MTHYEVLYDIAADNYGIVTAREAKMEGISDKEMSAITSRGRIRRLGYGVYKIVDYIPVENDCYAEAVALAGEDAYLFGESVLGMLKLAPTNPARIYVGSPRRVRRTLPKHIRIIHTPKEAASADYEGIASESVADAIHSCRGHMMNDRLLAAAAEARRLGYLNHEEEDRLIKEIGQWQTDQIAFEN